MFLQEEDRSGDQEGEAGQQGGEKTAPGQGEQDGGLQRLCPHLTGRVRSISNDLLRTFLCTQERARSSGLILTRLGSLNTFCDITRIDAALTNE